MEKYRKFSDTATGINPFTISRNPTTFSLAIAAIFFPMRLSIALVLALLLLGMDIVVYIFYVLGLLFALRHMLAFPQRMLLRGLLFCLGNLRVAREEPKATRHTDLPVSPRGGDLVLVNMQSVWDMCVLEVAAELPLAAIAFYIGHSDDPTRESKKLNKTNSECAGLVVFEPSPFQRWRVWSHVYRTGSPDFLRRAVGGGSGSTCSNGEVVDVLALQQRSAGLGIPLVLFAEGSCTNGKGILHIPPLRTATELARILVVAVDYDTPAVHTVVQPSSLIGCLFAMSSQLHGSRDPAWSSPLLPTATVRLAAAGNATGSDIAVIRRALCGASRTRQPLSVGLREKHGYVSEYLGVRSV